MMMMITIPYNHNASLSYIISITTMPSPPPVTTTEDTYEELDLDDEPLTPTVKQEPLPTKASPSNSFSYSNHYTSPTSRDEDAWRSSIPSSSSASRFSTSTADVTSPPTLETASTGTSRASGSMSGPSGAAILGVAVVDFNHLVSCRKHHVR